MAITLTPNAASHVQRSLSKRGKGLGLRVGVRTSGCSGLAYKLEFADQVNPGDLEFEATASGWSSTRRACSSSTAPSSATAARAERGLQVQEPEGQGRMRLRGIV